MKFRDIHQCDEYCETEYVGVGRPPVPWCRRFEAKVGYAENGCWIWLPVKGRKDSERNRLNFSLRSQHFEQTFDLPAAMDACRWIYQRVVGPIEEDLDLDHFHCNNWRCVNPYHLEPVTNWLNNHRYRHIRAEWTVRDSAGKFAGRKGDAK